MGVTERDIMPTNLYGRVSKLLETFEWSDCCFSVSGIDFKAHRLIMAISSPVFKAMFYGPLSTSDNIVISDIEPDIFKLLINYIYTDKVDISSIENALELLYASKKYFLEYLEEKCTDYIKTNLSVDNVVYVLNFAEFIQEDTLISCTLKLFCEHAEYLMFSNIDRISCSSLKLILKSNEINASERDLILFIFKWAKVYCNINDLPETLENKREVLVHNGIFKMLRFSVLSIQDLDEIVSDDNNLLNNFEIKEIQETVSSGIDKAKFLAESNIILAPDVKCRDSLKVKMHMCLRGMLRSTSPIIVDAYNNLISVKIKADRTIFLNSLKLPTRMTPLINYYRDYVELYSEQFSVSVICESDCSLIKFTNFINTVEYDSEVLIEFSESCILRKNDWYVINFVWPINRCHPEYKYLVAHRDVSVNEKVKFEFEDLLNDGSFLMGLKFSL